MKLNVKAANLATKLFELVAEFKALSAAAWSTGDVDTSIELDAVACSLADTYVRLTMGRHPNEGDNR